MTSAATTVEPPAPETASSEPVAAPLERLKASAQRMLVVLIDRAAGAALEKVDDLSGRLEEVRQSGGVGLGAAFGAADAWMAGKNPVWGAIKGGFGALSTGAKVGVIALLVLLGLLSPVALLVALVALLIIAIVKAAKTNS